MKVIKNIFGFIFLLILIPIILFILKSALNTIKYNKHDETGIMKNGNLCISHMLDGGGGCYEEYYNSDNNVLKEVEDFYITDGIRLGIGNTEGDVFGKVYQPINAGKSDIYVGYSKTGGEDIRYFELYHVEVDKDLNITYNMEIIDKERFEQVQE